ncbi:MAG TPA: outer membrane beta-barrel protein [Polyangiales bacterium]|nr:outer membrane beta-barrel protein [Polyangiales bacterium]
MFALAGPVTSAHALELRLGVKGAVTLNGMISVEPTDVPLEPWHNASIGAGFGGGVYVDLHFTKIFAMQLDALIEGNRLFFDSYEGENYLEQAVVYEQLRLPLFFKLVARLGRNAEFTGALGPEFLFGLGATPHSALYPPQQFTNYYGADEQFGLALSAAFGVGILTQSLHIPIELRFGYNVLGAYSYTDRVHQFGSQIYVLQAQENFQFALTVGFGFRIPPEQPPKKPKPKVEAPAVDDPFYYPDLPDGRPRKLRPW